MSPPKDPSVTVHPSPPGDQVFVVVARRLAARSSATRGLQDSLRSLYPDALVMESEVEGLRRWYVCRDGHWTP